MAKASSTITQSGVGHDRAGAKQVLDTRRLRRILSAILMPIGPLIVALPSFLADDDSLLFQRIKEGSGAIHLDAALSSVAFLTLVPGIYTALHLTRRRAPLLTLWTGAVLVPAYLGMSGLVVINAVTWAGVQNGFDEAATDKLVESAFGSPWTIPMIFIFVLGHAFGTLMLGVLAIRTRYMPMWFGVLFAISQFVHVIANITDQAWLDHIGWGTTAIGMGVLAWRVLRTPDDEWDLPPLPRAAWR